jgi:hypothetical protein
MLLLLLLFRPGSREAAGRGRLLFVFLFGRAAA